MAAKNEKEWVAEIIAMNNVPNGMTQKQWIKQHCELLDDRIIFEQKADDQGEDER